MRRSLEWTRGSVLMVCGLACAVVAALACERTQPVQHGEELRKDCYGCHFEDYRAVSHPPHVGVRPTTCAVCHLERAWKPSVLQHPWPLTGAHRDTDCFSCHVGSPPKFEGTAEACVACHREDYDKSEYPGHDEFPLTCADCHTTRAFRPAQRNLHAAATAAGASEPSAAHGTRPAKTREPSVSKAAPAAKKRAPKRREASARAGEAPATSAETKRATPVVKDVPVSNSPAAQVEPAPAEREHPENAFPIASGPHAEIECKTCHDRGGRMGKGNTDCVQCHKRSRYDRIHSDVARYPTSDAPVNFCVQCHTRGRVRPIAR
jgi:hypothetical protein